MEQTTPSKIFISPVTMVTPKFKLKEPVFKTPMTYSPRLLGDKHVPSPSRMELWKQQMGLDEDPDGDRCTSDSESEASERRTPRSTKKDEAPSSPCTFIEYQTLKRELDERNSQRDELLFRIKSLTDKTKKYKGRLEKEETTRRQQVKIMRKSHDSHLEEKERLIRNLEDVIEENETRVEQLEAQLQGRHSDRLSPSLGASSRLVEQIKRLQKEKLELTSKLDTLQHQLDTQSTEDLERGDLLHETIAGLKNEKQDLLAEIINLKNLVENTEAGPCTTDNEKQIEKLQLENEKLLHQLTEQRQTVKTESLVAYKELLQRADEERHKLRSQIDSLEEEMITKSEEHVENITRYKSENLKLLKEKQFINQQMRDMRAEVTALQAREPEVVTKVRRVEVQVESEQLTKAYHVTQTANQRLTEQVESLHARCNDMNMELCSSKNKNSQLEKQVSEFTAEVSEVNRQMATEIHSLERRKDEAVIATKKEMDQKFRSLRTNYEKLRLKLSLVHPLLMEVIDSYDVLRKQCYEFPRLLQASMEHVKQETSTAICHISEQNKDLLRKYRKEMTLRKKFHNELVELKGNIRVLCRVRPRNKVDSHHSHADSVVSYDADDDTIIHVSHKGRRQTFDLDKVFQEHSTQVEVFEEVKSLVTSCIDGFNVCIFAYGQTGSGKTYTMEGLSGNPGINQRALIELFDEVVNKGQDWEYTISVSVLEIYNESIRDLLSNDTSYKLEVKMSGSDKGYYVPGLTTVKVQSVQDVNTVFTVGQRNRATAETNMNEHSSRSHALLCVTVMGVNGETHHRTTGKLNLVDLAGSERVSKSGADGARLREAQNINKSLSSLGDVIHALRGRQNFVPYRNSKLTYLLQDSLKGDSKTLMIVQIAPTERHVCETLCTLNFAQRVRSVELGMANRRVEPMDTENAGSPCSPTKGLTKTTSASALSPSNRLLAQTSSNVIASNRIANLMTQSTSKGSKSTKSSPSSGKSPLARAVTPLLKPLRRKLNVHS